MSSGPLNLLVPLEKGLANILIQGRGYSVAEAKHRIYRRTASNFSQVQTFGLVNYYICYN